MYDNSTEMMLHHVQLREMVMWRRRTLIGVLIGAPVAFSLLYCIISFVSPIRSILGHKDELLSAQVQGLKAIPDLQLRMDALNAQLKSLTTTSIEARLTAIESAIRVGDLKPDQIASVGDIRRDVDTLKTYMFHDPRDLVDFKQMQKDYRDLSSSLQGCASKTDMDAKIASANNMLFLSWGFFGILFTVLLGPRLWSRKTSIPTQPVSHPQSPPPSGGPAESDKTDGGAK